MKKASSGKKGKRGTRKKATATPIDDTVQQGPSLGDVGNGALEGFEELFDSVSRLFRSSTEIQASDPKATIDLPVTEVTQLCATTLQMITYIQQTNPASIQQSMQGVWTLVCAVIKKMSDNASVEIETKDLEAVRGQQLNKQVLDNDNVRLYLGDLDDETEGGEARPGPILGVIEGGANEPAAAE